MTDEPVPETPAPINPALTETPSAYDANLSPITVCARFNAALMQFAANVSEDNRSALSDALATVSPVVRMAKVFELMTAVPEGGEAATATCGSVLLSRTVEIADILSAHDLMGHGEAATAFSATARAQLGAAQ